MKKLFTLLLCSLFALTLVGCGSGGGDSTSTFDTENLTVATSREVQQLDYTVTALATDHEVNANLVDGLLEADQYGNLVGALAETWESNEDQSVWTFHLREGVNWVTSTGDVYGEVTAQDFVTGMRHGAEFGSGTAYLLQGVVVGYNEYLKSDFSDEAWEEVGVKAVDDYTVEYTLVNPTPYFPSMTTYAVLYPINAEFLESKGDGCALGAPDDETCGFGTVELDSILYNGGYILTTYDAQSSAVLTKNDQYWDADNVHLKTVTRIYDDGSDPYSTINGFEQGVYAQAALNPGWENYDKYVEKYDGLTHYTEPNASVFGLVFNYNRQTFDHTNYAGDEALRENTINAIRNANFRRALRAAWDRVAYNAVDTPEDLATAMLRNVNNFPECGSTSDGRDYFTLVSEAYEELTGEAVDLSDGQNPWDSATAMDYIAAAEEEGVVFPVHLDMLVPEEATSLVNQSNSMKQSVEEATNGQIVIELVYDTLDNVQAIAYYNTDPAKADYDISTFTGWSPDYQDPKSFVDIYSATAGYYMTSMGLTNNSHENFGSDDALKEELGFYEYEELYRAADAISDDLDARYEAFAKADAYLVAECLFIPGYMDARGNVVSHYVPFSAPYANYGTSEYKYKRLQLQADIVTTEQYETARAEWEAVRHGEAE